MPRWRHSGKKPWFEPHSRIKIHRNLTPPPARFARDSTLPRLSTLILTNLTEHLDSLCLHVGTVLLSDYPPCTSTTLLSRSLPLISVDLLTCSLRFDRESTLVTKLHPTPRLTRATPPLPPFCFSFERMFAGSRQAACCAMHGKLFFPPPRHIQPGEEEHRRQWRPERRAEPGLTRKVPVVLERFPARRGDVPPWGRQETYIQPVPQPVSSLPTSSFISRTTKGFCCVVEANVVFVCL